MAMSEFRAEADEKAAHSDRKSTMREASNADSIASTAGNGNNAAVNSLENPNTECKSGPLDFSAVPHGRCEQRAEVAQRTRENIRRALLSCAANNTARKFEQT